MHIPPTPTGLHQVPFPPRWRVWERVRQNGTPKPVPTPTAPAPTSRGRRRPAPEVHWILAGRRKPPEFPVPCCAPRQGHRKRWGCQGHPGLHILKSNRTPARESHGSPFSLTALTLAPPLPGRFRGGWACTGGLRTPANIRRASGAEDHLGPLICISRTRSGRRAGSPDASGSQNTSHRPRQVGARHLTPNHRTIGRRSTFGVRFFDAIRNGSSLRGLRLCASELTIP